MAIDTSILNRLQPFQAPDPVNQLARVLQVKDAQQAQQMNAMKMDEYKRGVEDQNALRSALGQPDADPYKVLLGRGRVKEATDFAKGQADIGKTNAEADAKAVETAHKRIDGWGQAMQHVRQNPTPQNAAAAANFLVNMGLVPREKAQALLADVNPADPQSIAQWADRGYRASLSAKDQLPKYDTRNLGGTTQMTAVDPVSGQVRVVNSAQNTQSPDNKASVGAQYAIANAAREQAKATREAAQITADSKRMQDTEMKLADDYRTESKGFAETSTAMKKVLAAIETADKNPGSALAAGTGFMKILDPTSVVRETELGMALNASGWFDRAMNIANTLANGRVMTPEQKKNLRSAAVDLFEEAKAAQREIDAAYNKRAADYKLDPKRIITDRGQNVPRAPVDFDSLPAGKPRNQPSGRGNAPVAPPRELQWGK